MKVSSIYEKYKIPPHLQKHMLRVTSVASIISENIDLPVDKKSIITSTLLHDMGNIVKFDFDNFPVKFDEKTINEWKETKKEFEKKYGKKDHEATYNICLEIGIKPNILKIIDNIGFSNLINTYKADDYSIKIPAYSDLRVSPMGIVLLRERLEDLKKRYAKRIQENYFNGEFEKHSSAIEKIENQIFSLSKIGPEDVNEEKVNAIVEEFRDFEIETK